MGCSSSKQAGVNPTPPSQYYELSVRRKDGQPTGQSGVMSRDQAERIIHEAPYPNSTSKKFGKRPHAHFDIKNEFEKHGKQTLNGQPWHPGSKKLVLWGVSWCRRLQLRSRCPKELRKSKDKSERRAIIWWSYARTTSYHHRSP